MATQGRPILRRFSAIAALLLFGLFAGNIVMAKLASMMQIQVPLLPALAEFLILHAATIAGVIFLFCEEQAKGMRQEE